MIGSITTLLAGVLVSGKVYRVECAPDGPSSPIWLSDDALDRQTCSCGCGLPLVDFDDDWCDDGLTCLACGTPLGYDTDSDFCSEYCAQDHLIASLF